MSEIADAYDLIEKSLGVIFSDAAPTLSISNGVIRIAGKHCVMELYRSEEWGGLWHDRQVFPITPDWNSVSASRVDFIVARMFAGFTQITTQAVMEGLQ